MSEEFISVKVGSMYYRITADEDPDYVKEVAKQANEMIQDLKARHLGLGDTAAAVLALLNALDQIAKQKDSGVDYYQEIADSQKALQEAKADFLRLREQLWDTKKDLLYYRNLCDLYEEKLNAVPATPARKSSTKPAKIAPLDKLQATIEEMPRYDKEVDKEVRDE